ncbi:MAG TPA: oligosaccharide flippase family protein [Puia sp.]|nr:oligosaccharide flippase family protein [Puia sp.]
MNAARWVRVRIAPYRESVLIKRLFAVLSIDILVKLSGMLLLPVYLRLMTQDEYGLYNYLISIILTFSLVFNFGLYIPLSKFYHDHIDAGERGELLFTIFVLLSLVLMGVLIPVYLFHWDYRIVKILFKNDIGYDSYRWAILLAMIASVCNFMLTNFFYTSEKIGNLKRYNIWRIICINVLNIGLLLLYRSKVSSVLIRLACTYLVEIVIFSVFVRAYIREVRPVFRKETAVSSLRLALPVMISAVFGIVINFNDKFFLEKYTSFKDLSYYFLAVACASLIPLVFTSFQNAWLPLFLKEKDLRKNIEKTKKLLIRLFLGFSALSVLMILFLKIVLVLGIIQSKYSETIYILPILLLSQIFSALVPLYTNYLIYFEKTYITSITGLALCAASIGLSLLLIPRFGVYGAATVSLASNLSYLMIYYFIIKANLKKSLS